MEKIISDEFANQYKNKKIKWGFNGLGYIVYKRTYSREREDGKLEEWHETIQRCINGSQKIGAGYTKQEAEKLFDLIFNLKCCFGGRMLWQLGTPMVDKFLGNSLLNCWFTTIRKIDDFCFIFENLMLGGGVGYSIRREDIHELPRIKRDINITIKNTKDADFIVPDSREGWIRLLYKILDAFFYSGKSFNYSTILVRGVGEKIATFGGKASGPKILENGILNICNILKNREGKKARSIDVLDICNIIGSIVVAGNVRRSAEIALGDPDDILFLRAKRWDLGNIPNWRTMSNNTIYADNYDHIMENVWDGYAGNGEPYGFFNLDLSQNYGRLKDKKKDNAIGLNPCAEVTLADKECCVSYDTLLITRDGIIKIGDATNLNKEIEIWNGKKWNKVFPCKTKSNQELYRVSFNDGSYLDCTSYHKFSIADRFADERYNQVETKNLFNISKYSVHTEPFTIEYNDGKIYEKDAYTLGFAVGDGHVKGKRTKIVLYGLKDMKCPIIGERQGVKHFIRYNVEHQEVDVTENAEPILVKNLKNNSSSLDQLFFWDKKSILNFIAGLADADGSNASNGIRIYISDYIRANKMQLLLTKCGIRSSVNLLQKKGCKTNLAIRNRDLYYLQITNTKDIPCFRLRCENSVDGKYKNKWQIVKKVEKLNGLHDVYCFNETERHMGVFNNVLTYQCNLSDIFLNNVESKEEFMTCSILLYKTQKAICAMKFINEETERVVHKNFRLGQGITGICQSIDKLEWLDDCYNKLREFDKKWSKERSWPESLKLTACKPSGTVSLLAGATPGIHPSYSEFYFRTIRMSSSDFLIELCKRMNYKVEYSLNFDKTIDRSTVVVYFPCNSGLNTIISKNMKAIDQLDLMKRIQSEWADNAVSCTVYYHPEELNDIKQWLKKNYQNSVKSVSFLLHQNHGFLQAPYIEITKDEYNESIKEIKPLEILNLNNNFSMENLECSSGSCPIK